jgi:HEAT repeat protein
VLWAIGRLSQARPDLTKDAVPHVIRFLESPDAGVRGLAAWITGLLRLREARKSLEKLTEDDGEVRLYLGQRLVRLTVKGLAEEALASLSTE